jgi:hypothetical protein
MTKEITVEQGETSTLDFPLELQKGNIQGTVTDASTGNAISRPSVQIAGSTVQTGTDGKYQISLKPGIYQIIVSADRYIQQTREVTVESGRSTQSDFELELEDGILSGTVTDSGTSEPIAGAFVEINGETFETEQGEYQIPLRPGDYTIIASADTYEPQEKPATIAPGETTTLDFGLKMKDGTLSGTVLDADTTQPVSGAIVNAGGREAEVNSRGDFEILLPPGTYEVNISASEYLIRGQQVEIEPDRTIKLDFTALPALEVWPGDTNNDERVSILDILPIGRFWNKEGDRREPQGEEWGMGLTTYEKWDPREAAFADGDGNGIVDEQDVIAIVKNWNPEAILAPEPIESLRLLADKDMLDKYRRMYQVVIGLEDGEGAIELKTALGKLICELIPKRSALLANYPNPFNPETWIPFILAESGEVEIKIYNVAGRMVRMLTLGRMEEGYYVQKDKAAYWDGRNEMSEQVASGVYFYAIRVGDFASARKMLVIK